MARQLKEQRLSLLRDLEQKSAIGFLKQIKKRTIKKEIKKSNKKITIIIDYKKVDKIAKTYTKMFSFVFSIRKNNKIHFNTLLILGINKI